MKMLRFGTKNVLFGYFWAAVWKWYCYIWNQHLRILKNYCYISNQHPRICQITKFCEKMKMPKFGTKNAWFAYIWGGIWKYFCHIWNLRPWICFVTKFGAKIKILKFGTKNAWFGNLGLGFENNIVILEILNLSNWKISWNNKNA